MPRTGRPPTDLDDDARLRRQRLAWWCTLTGQDQSDLAGLLGCDRSRVSLWVRRGDTENSAGRPPKVSAERLAEATGWPLDYWSGGLATLLLSVKGQVVAAAHSGRPPEPAAGRGEHKRYEYLADEAEGDEYS